MTWDASQVVSIAWLLAGTLVKSTKLFKADYTTSFTLDEDFGHGVLKAYFFRNATFLAFVKRVILNVLSPYFGEWRICEAFPMIPQYAHPPVC